MATAEVLGSPGVGSECQSGGWAEIGPEACAKIVSPELVTMEGLWKPIGRWRVHGDGRRSLSACRGARTQDGCHAKSAEWHSQTCEFFGAGRLHFEKHYLSELSVTKILRSRRNDGIFQTPRTVGTLCGDGRFSPFGVAWGTNSMSSGTRV